MKKIIVSLACIGYLSSSFLSSSYAMAQEDHSHHQHHHMSASTQAPIGVMGEHLHAKGKMMMSYRFMKMDMDGNRIGSHRVSARDVVGTGANPGQFMVAPTSMPMDMHMLGLMFGLTNNITVAAMTNFVSKKMDHLVRNGRTFSTESSGLGDSRVSALIGLKNTGNHRWLLNLGINLPTGSTDERDDTPVMDDAFLPYPMQLGSGTFDLLSGVTYLGQWANWTWGAQALATIRTGDNDEGYTLGDQLDATVWLARKLNQRLSFSVRLKYQDWGNIDGENQTLNPMMVQTANTALQAGSRTDLSLGLNYLLGGGHQLAIEYAKPVSQDLDGPQLEVDSVVTIGWRKIF